MKYKVSYLEDFFTVMEEVIIECDDEKDIKKLVDEYYKKNLSHLGNIAGANWVKLEEED